MKGIFSVYDSAAKYFLDPFVVLNVGAALREFATACNNKDSFLYAHPGDFTLFYLGDFDEQTGEFIMQATPAKIGMAIEYKKSQEVYHADNIKPS